MARKPDLERLVRERVRRQRTAPVAKETAGQPEVSFEQEHTALMAEHSYLNLGPQIVMGEVPSSRLLQWRDALSGGRRSVSRLMNIASLDIEAVRSLASELRKPNGRPQGYPEVKPLISHAKRTLEDTLQEAAKEYTEFGDDPEIPIEYKDHLLILGLRAELLLSGLDVYQAQFTDLNATRLKKAKDKYVEEQIAIARKALTHFADRSDGESQQFLHELTGLLLLGINFSVFPTPARFWNSQVDQEHQTQLFVNANGFDFAVRVGQGGDPDVMQITPENLSHDRYPVDHPYGTLSAAISFYEERIHPPKGGQIILAHDLRIRQQRDSHIQSVLDTLTEHLNNQGPMETVRKENRRRKLGIPSQVVDWYTYISPYHQFEVYLPELQEMITIMEESDEALNKGELYTLAWMHAELGMRLTEDNVASTVDHFALADDFFGKSEQAANEHTEKADVYQIELDRFAIPVYQAIALRDQNLPAVVDTYRMNLITLADQLLVYKSGLNASQTKEIATIDGLLSTITAALLISTHEGGTYIAVPSTLRQAEAEDNPKRGGWDTTVWMETSNGSFKSNYFGRVTVPELKGNTENPYLVDANSVSLDVLYGLLTEISDGDQWQRQGDVAARKELIASAREQVLAVAEKFVD